MACVRHMKEVRPEFCFRDHDQFGAEQSQVGANSKREVKREVENVVLPKSSARQFLAGSRSRRDHYSMLRKLAAQSRH